MYQGIPALREHIRALLYCVIRGGTTPYRVLRSYLTRLDKPHRYQEGCSSERPISPKNSVAKVVEAAVYRRLLPSFEASFDPYQYAYCRQCSTRMHAAGLRNFAATALVRGAWVYLASVDVDGAFGAAPQASLIQTLERDGANQFCSRFLHT